MDTLSRDSSSSSSSIVPMAGLFAAVLALILAIVGLVKLSNMNKAITAQADEIGKIATIENEVRSAASKSEQDLQKLREGVQSVLTQVGNEMNAIGARVTEVEKAQKARATPPPAAKGGTTASAPTGQRNADGTYTVAAGDNLSAIARKFGVTLDAIQAENPGVEPRSLKVGQKLRIPSR
jgi:LysM repeat protein